MKILKYIVPVFFIFTLLLAPSIAKADPDPGCNPDEECPIDTNVVLLISAAVLVAGFKYYSNVKNKLAV
jgi:hypothetical protein